MLKPRMMLMLGAGLLTVLWTGLAAAEVVDRVVAIVNDEVITMSELEMMAKSLEGQPGVSGDIKNNSKLQRELLDALIDQKLARAEAKRRGINVSDKELDQALKEFKQQHHIPDDAALAQALSKAGLSLNELKQRMRDQIVQERMMQVAVGAKVTVTDAEVRHAYETEVPKEGGGTRLHLKILSLVFPPNATEAQKEEIKKKAETVLTERKQGASLEELGKKYDMPLQDLGFISQGDLDPKLAAFLSNLKPKDVGPIQTPQGFQLVELVARKSGGETRSFEEMAPQIRAALMRHKMAKDFAGWTKGLRQKASIKVML